VEEFLRISPFITDAEGKVAWQVTAETKLPERSRQADRAWRHQRLGGMQSCMLDCTELPLPKTFSGGCL